MVKKKSSAKKTRKKAGRKVRRKPGTRAGRKTPAKQRLWGRLIWRIFVFMSGLGLGILIPWVLILNHTVQLEFAGLTWERPSRVYARPLSLYIGQEINAKDLLTELQAAAYRKTESTVAPGSYSRSGNHWRIYSRDFEFADGHQAAQNWQVEIVAGKVSKIEDLSGNTLALARLDPAQIASIYPLDKQDRELLPLADIPPLLVSGLQAVEDRRFKSHYGVDPKAIARALWAGIRSGRIDQGGSTLTQQLVKNLFLDSSQTLLRKVNEALMALLLEFHFSKSEILEAYINQVYMGQHGAYAVHGFARASRFYFDRPLQNLDTAQIALLVGIVKGASWYNPRRNPERALARRNLVLQVFADTGLINTQDLQLATKQPLGVTKQVRGLRLAASGFIDLVKRQLRERYNEDDLRTEGLAILTTLEPVTQLAAEKAVAEGLQNLSERGLPKELQAAFIITDVQSGEIVALVGDRIPGRAGFNRALDARRQIGSIMKPLVYLLALEHPEQFNLLSRIDDSAVNLRLANGDYWQPRNYTNIEHGSVTLLDALVHSWNLATVNLGMSFGATHILQSLQRYGLDLDVTPVPSLILGTLELTPLEVTGIYQSLAAGGYRIPLRAVTAVIAEGGVLEESFRLTLKPLQNRKAISILNYALSRVTKEGTAKALPSLLGRNTTIAGKTGTTNDRKDSWFVGYTDQRLGVVWVGRDDNQPARVTGSSAALPIWARAFREIPLAEWQLKYPRGVENLWVERETSSLTGENCPGAEQMPFISTAIPTDKTDCLRQQENQGDKKSRRWSWFDRDEKDSRN